MSIDSGMAMSAQLRGLSGFSFHVPGRKSGCLDNRESSNMLLSTGNCRMTQLLERGKVQLTAVICLQSKRP